MSIRECAQCVSVALGQLANRRVKFYYFETPAKNFSGWRRRITLRNSEWHHCWEFPKSWEFLPAIEIR